MIFIDHTCDTRGTGRERERDIVIYFYLSYFLFTCICIYFRRNNDIVKSFWRHLEGAATLMYWTFQGHHDYRAHVDLTLVCDWLNPGQTHDHLAGEVVRHHVVVVQHRQEQTGAGLAHSTARDVGAADKSFTNILSNKRNATLIFFTM